MQVGDWVECLTQDVCRYGVVVWIYGTSEPFSPTIRRYYNQDAPPGVPQMKSGARGQNVACFRSSSDPSVLIYKYVDGRNVRSNTFLRFI